MNESISIIPEKSIERRVCVIRGHNVMLDKDLAELYGVKAIALRQQVKRNIDRFPDDFMFQLNEDEVQFLLSQNVIPSKRVLGGAFPYVFTQEGVAMLSSVLTSKRAVQVNITIMRTFVRMREAMASHKELARRIDDLEQKHDAQFRAVFDAIRQLMEPQAPAKKPIGYIHPKED